MEAIRSGMQPGLTLVVGPPGTGMTLHIVFVADFLLAIEFYRSAVDLFRYTEINFKILHVY